MIIKKSFISIFLLLISIFGVYQINSVVVESNAANVESRRVWIDINSTTWGSAGADTYLYAYNSSTHHVAWPGTKITSGVSTSNNYDSNNTKWYFDVPDSFDKFFFTRRDPNNVNTEWDRTVEYDTIDNNTPNYLFTLDYNVTDKRTVNSFNANETLIVENFASSTDDLNNSCTFAVVESIITAYNNLATFEQNQFDTKDFDGVTGLERLNYLIDISGATTALN